MEFNLSGCSLEQNIWPGFWHSLWRPKATHMSTKPNGPSYQMGSLYQSQLLYTGQHMHIILHMHGKKYTLATLHNDTNSSALLFQFPVDGMCYFNIFQANIIS